MALPKPEDEEPASAGNDSELGEDVVTLSYDRALRVHARYKPRERGDWAPETAASLERSLPPSINRIPDDALDRDLRTASVTVRLSKGECTRLHQRAAEAGLTVSAYLRSCTIEVEALRAQVKAALAELRLAAHQGTESISDRETKPMQQREIERERLVRVLAHVGSLCIGLTSGKSS